MPYKNLRRSAPAVTVKCIQCGKSMQTTDKGVAKHVTGWVVPRDQGGANHIRWQNTTGDFAHVGCLEEMYDPVKTGQGNLFA